ncbi:MAG: KOW domain-containing RNA-binding protein [Oscillospiraceae bacterium]|jgi:ribosomal protein L14E/L6E/L27E|nr:KOW domain-containing RNA-binding protein [Oscillospiraceae bacterium]
MELEMADIVVSRNGRDRGKKFFIVGLDGGEYALLADGRGRRIEKPKRKKARHVVLDFRNRDGRTAVKLRNGERVTNSELRKAIAEYAAARTADKGGI